MNRYTSIVLAIFLSFFANNVNAMICNLGQTSILKQGYPITDESEAQAIIPIIVSPYNKRAQYICDFKHISTGVGDDKVLFIVGGIDGFKIDADDNQIYVTLGYASRDDKDELSKTIKFSGSFEKSSGSIEILHRGGAWGSVVCNEKLVD